MNAPIDTQIIRGSDGKPEYAVIPYKKYRELIGKKDEDYIPHEVVGKIVAGATPCRAWREYRELTQADMAVRLKISQSAYAQLEASEKLRPSSRRKLAEALGTDPDFLVR
jgi:DNA-binding XRE family transcriptional regulator